MLGVQVGYPHAEVHPGLVHSSNDDDSEGDDMDDDEDDGEDHDGEDGGAEVSCYQKLLAAKMPTWLHNWILVAQLDFGRKRGHVQPDLLTGLALLSMLGLLWLACETNAKHRVSSGGAFFFKAMVCCTS